MGSVSALCACLVVSRSRRFDSYRAFRSNTASQNTRSLRRDLKLGHLTFAIVMIILFGGGFVEAQSPGQRSTRDIVDELSRIDTNRAVDLQKIKGTNTNAVREAIQKQISDDFRELQSLNNKMMATAWSQPDLDYKFISRMVDEIGKKAARLQANLALPKSEEKQQSTKSSGEISTTEEFKAELLDLDRSVMSFVKNPIFQKTHVIELSLANQANRDLETVIEMSKKLKKVTAKLRKK